MHFRGTVVRNDGEVRTNQMAKKKQKRAFTKKKMLELSRKINALLDEIVPIRMKAVELENKSCLHVLDSIPLGFAEDRLEDAREVFQGLAKAK